MKGQTRIDENKYHRSHSIPPSKGEKGQYVGNGDTKLTQDAYSLPLAVISETAINNNVDWMQRFAQQHNVKLCPHGKTTMTPDLFQRQLLQGAWGITVATAAQAEVAASAGAKQIIIANQLVGRANMALVGALQDTQNVSVYCCVDSVENLEQLNAHFAHYQHPIQVFIERGVAGGRCGCRGDTEIITLAAHIDSLPNVSLVGIEFYEGVIHGENAAEQVGDLVNSTLALTLHLKASGFIDGKPKISGAGSAWYDIVAEHFADLNDIDAIIRPGCYAIHDTGIYAQAQQQILERAIVNNGVACHLGGDLISSLEVWAHILSAPEKGKLVAGLGKRDVAFDAGLPIAERAFRDGEKLSLTGIKATAVMDQHTFLEVDESCNLKVGDIVVFSTSHPCLTFDKWRKIAVRNDIDEVIDWVDTHF